MIATSDNTQDVNKYFQNTFIVVPEVTPEHVMLLVKAREDGLVCQDSRTNQEGFISFADDYTYEIQSPLVTRKAWFMYEGSPYLISRVPARMWRKGIDKQNTVINAVTPSGNLTQVGLSTKLLNAYLQTDYPDALEDKKDLQVLSPEWVFNSKTNVIQYWHFVVGKTSKRTKEIFVPREYASLMLPKHFAEWTVKHV